MSGGGRVAGKVALVTGGARGQGRAHALRLAEEGADILILDSCEDVRGATYQGPTEADLAETAGAIEALGRRVVAHKGDVRDQAAVDRIVEAGIAELGGIDVLVNNAGVTLIGCGWEISEEDWETQIGINLTGSWRVAKTVIPHMIEAGKGGSIIMTSSSVVNRALGNLGHYAASKYGVEGLCRELAVELGPHRIRVNTLQPGSVNTVMFDHQAAWELFTPGQEGLPIEQRRQAALGISQEKNLLPTPWVQPEDLANCVLFLASDEAQMVTGSSFRVDAGFSAT